MKKFIFYFLALNTLLFFSNCKVSQNLKAKQIYSKPSSIVTQKDYFRKEIPIKIEGGVIIIPVKIEDKTYNFVFDPNSECAISYDLASKLTNSCPTKKVVDKKAQQEWDINIVPNINIKGIDFENNIVGLADMSCNNFYNISGIIGANLMRNAIWQIDYQNKKIILTNSTDSLCSSDTKYIDFQSSIAGNPYFDIHFSPYIGVRTEFSMTAYTGLLLPEWVKGSTMPSNSKYLKSYESNNTHIDTFKYVAAPYLRFDGGWILRDNPVTFNRYDGNAVMGYLFLKNYIVTLNWEDKKIGFQQVKNTGKTIDFAYGFYYEYQNEKVIIRQVFENSAASAVNLQIEEQLLAIDGKDVSNISQNEYYKMVRSRNSEEDKRTEVSITVKQKDGVKTFLLKKADINL